MRNFYDPTPEHLTRLSEPWCCSYSGGKDSSSMVTWLEWLRRSDWLTIEHPQLVRSDTMVEDPNLIAVAEELTAVLERHGWECALVRPAIHERLYNRILGIGNTPIHPGINSMRWCTRSTKIDPMARFKAAGRLSITGLRLGESAMRDGKLKRRGCSAGGECGIPDPGEGNYSPILHWKTCQVIDWLEGAVDRSVRRLMDDVYAVTKRLLDIYEVERRTVLTLFGEETEVAVARFGCIGCPAIGAEAHAPQSVVARHGADSPLCELYDVWFTARRPASRCWGPNWRRQFGPIKMAVRKQLFERVMDIQRRAGVTLIRPEDEAFIRDCWERKVYPRGWSEADEATVPPSDTPLFDVEGTPPQEAAAEGQ